LEDLRVDRQPFSHHHDAIEAYEHARWPGGKLRKK
jgi:hypothetical protein